MTSKHDKRNKCAQWNVRLCNALVMRSGPVIPNGTRVFFYFEGEHTRTIQSRSGQPSNSAGLGRGTYLASS